MTSNLICFVAGTRDCYDGFLNSSLNRFLNHVDARCRVMQGNPEGLGAVYNQAIDQLLEEPGWDIAVFVHDDVDIQDLYYAQKLQRALETFDVVGLAGTATLPISNRTMWHVSPKNQHSGAVAHPFPPGSGSNLFSVASFGPTPRCCIVVDGLFMAVRVDTLRRHPEVRFDHQFKFYYYDLDFCLTAHAAGLRIGTWPIWVTHQSPGLDSWDNVAWQRARDRFNAKWGGPNGYRVTGDYR